MIKNSIRKVLFFINNNNKKKDYLMDSKIEKYLHELKILETVSYSTSVKGTRNIKTNFLS
jgi:hypothetical protein